MLPRRAVLAANQEGCLKGQSEVRRGCGWVLLGEVCGRNPVFEESLKNPHKCPLKQSQLYTAAHPRKCWCHSTTVAGGVGLRKKTHRTSIVSAYQSTFHCRKRMKQSISIKARTYISAKCGLTAKGQDSPSSRCLPL